MKSAYVVCCLPETRQTFAAVSDAHRRARDCDVFVVTHGGTSSQERAALEAAALEHASQVGFSHVVLGATDAVRRGAFTRCAAWATSRDRLGAMIVAWCLSEPDYFAMLRERYVGEKYEVVVKVSSGP